MDADHKESNVNWSEETAQSYREFHLSGEITYPNNLSKDSKKNFRRRARDFTMQDGKLYYTRKGGLRLAITSKEEQRIFQVSQIMNN